MEENSKTAYCVRCGDTVPYEIRWRVGKCQVRGVLLECEERAAFCLRCHNVVWVDGIDEFNVRSTRTAYCKKVGLVTPEETEEVMRKYGLGTKPLSELLGWDEEVLLRCLKGTIPSEKVSGVLKELLVNENAFFSLLDVKKDSIKPEVYTMLTERRKRDGSGTRQ